MGPHKFIIGAVTNAARGAIENVGGSVEPYRYTDVHDRIGSDKFMVTLPSNARYGTHKQWVTELDGIRSRWNSIDIEIRGLVLVSTRGHEDLNGTLDIAQESTK